MANLLQMWDLLIGADSQNEDASTSNIATRGFRVNEYQPGMRAHRSLNAESGFADAAEYSKNKKYDIRFSGGISEILKSVSTDGYGTGQEASPVTRAQLKPTAGPSAGRLQSYQEMMKAMQGDGGIRKVEPKRPSSPRSRTIKTTSLPGSKRSSMHPYEATMAMMHIKPGKTPDQTSYEDYTKQALKNKSDQPIISAQEEMMRRQQSSRVNGRTKPKTSSSYQDYMRVAQSRSKPRNFGATGFSSGRR